MFGIAPIASSTPKNTSPNVATTTSSTSTVSSTGAVINAPQGAAAVLTQAGYLPLGLSQGNPNAPIHWSCFAPPLGPSRTHSAWATQAPASHLVSPDVVRLPRRIFATSNPENIDLRITFTDAEVAYAESTIGSMTTFDDIVKQTGTGGVLFGAADPNNPDKRWGQYIQHAEQAMGEISRIEKLCNSVIHASPPQYIRNILNADAGATG